MKSKVIAKKTIILYVLNVLKKLSSQEFPVSQKARDFFISFPYVLCKLFDNRQKVRYNVS